MVYTGISPRISQTSYNKQKGDVRLRNMQIDMIEKITLGTALGQNLLSNAHLSEYVFPSEPQTGA